MNDDAIELSERARARQREMLPGLLLVARARRRRRTIGRASAAGLPLIVAGVAVWFARVPMPPGASTDVRRESSPGGVRLVRVADDPSIAERWRSRVLPPPVTRIDDDELLAELSGAGLPEGLVKVGGRTILASTIPPPIPGRS